MNYRTAILSTSEVILLKSDMIKMALAIRYSSIAFPFLITFTIACWYFNWPGMLTFISAALSLCMLIVFIVGIVHTHNIKKDLSANTKVIVDYILQEKYVEGYQTRVSETMNSQKVKMRIDISDEQIKNAIEHKVLNNGNYFSASGQLKEI